MGLVDEAAARHHLPRVHRRPVRTAGRPARADGRRPSPSRPCTRRRASSGIRATSSASARGSCRSATPRRFEQIDEERRLLYVGITRARRTLRAELVAGGIGAAAQAARSRPDSWQSSAPALRVRLVRPRSVAPVRESMTTDCAAPSARRPRSQPRSMTRRRSTAAAAHGGDGSSRVARRASAELAGDRRPRRIGVGARRGRRSTGTGRARLRRTGRSSHGRVAEHDGEVRDVAAQPVAVALGRDDAMGRRSRRPALARARRSSSASGAHVDAALGRASRATASAVAPCAVDDHERLRAPAPRAAGSIDRGEHRARARRQGAMRDRDRRRRVRRPVEPARGTPAASAAMHALVGAA